MTTNNDKVFEALMEAYKWNGIALVLGAGVSFASNIPSWKYLLHRVAKNKREAAVFNQLEKKDFPLTVIASYLQEQFDIRNDFVEAVRDALYEDFPFKDRKAGKDTSGEIRDFIRYGDVKSEYKKPGVRYCPNLTLRGIGALCTVKRLGKNKEGKLVPRNFANPKIRAIVTLNMDSLLQTYISAFSTKRLVRTVERASAVPFPDCINLYHMHGYLHFNEKENSQIRDAVEAVVLTEQDYYDFYNQSNSMFNYTFLYLLREHPCLFIGLSMQDENIRRLLHYSKLERMRAYASKNGITLEQLGADEKSMEKEIKRHVVILLRDEDPRVDEANEDTLGALGVKVLWVDDYSEIPECLMKLYISLPEDAKNWRMVYGRDKAG